MISFVVKGRHVPKVKSLNVEAVYMDQAYGNLHLYERKLRLLFFMSFLHEFEQEYFDVLQKVC